MGTFSGHTVCDTRCRQSLGAVFGMPLSEGKNPQADGRTSGPYEGCIPRQGGHCMGCKEVVPSSKSENKGDGFLFDG